MKPSYFLAGRASELDLVKKSFLHVIQNRRQQLNKIKRRGDVFDGAIQNSAPLL